jgi:hypothetical protein
LTVCSEGSLCLRNILTKYNEYEKKNQLESESESELELETEAKNAIRNEELLRFFNKWEERLEKEGGEFEKETTLFQAIGREMPKAKEPKSKQPKAKEPKAKKSKNQRPKGKTLPTSKKPNNQKQKSQNLKNQKPL